MKKINWKILIVSLVIVALVAFIGSLFTIDTDSEWYDSIKPSITPPNWVFPVVWNILFFLIALSLYFVLVSKKQKNKILTIYLVNFILNILWSVLFFTYKKTKIAFFELIILWISILLMVILSYKINKKASYLLIPYLLWVSFAGILNYLMAF